MDDFLDRTAHEIDLQSENMREVITRAMEYILQLRHGHANIRNTGTQCREGKKSPPRSSDQHSAVGNAVTTQPFLRSPKLVHNVNKDKSLLLTISFSKLR